VVRIKISQVTSTLEKIKPVKIAKIKIITRPLKTLAGYNLASHNNNIGKVTLAR
jgi:hypothetical protein